MPQIYGGIDYGKIVTDINELKKSIIELISKPITETLTRIFGVKV